MGFRTSIHVSVCYAMHAVPSYAPMLSYAMLCYAMLCYAMLSTDDPTVQQAPSDATPPRRAELAFAANRSEALFSERVMDDLWARIQQQNEEVDRLNEARVSVSVGARAIVVPRTAGRRDLASLASGGEGTELVSRAGVRAAETRHKT